jgi:hypothetical protein
MTNYEAQMSNEQQNWFWHLGIWILFGIWILIFGIYL